MKGYEDLVAGLLLLVVVLIGGYTYLNSQLIKQKEVLQISQKHVELKADKKDVSKFEVANKRTE